MTDKFFAFIGLEIHLQLKTQTKLFCSCKADSESSPNTNVCPVCLGYPGTLPGLNQYAVELAVRMGQICHSKINRYSEFDRKNYFYPDLPKGYQITQFFKPICREGFFEYFDSGGNLKKINLERIHLEEDAGKIIVNEAENIVFIDYNRAGVPLLELVTLPEFGNEEDVTQFLKFLQLTTREMGICDASPEKGNMRCDVNISVSDKPELPPYKTELKNLNSFKFIRDAIAAEIRRQKDLLINGKSIRSGTARWDTKAKKIKFMRTKEEVDDYRYFPEPDLPVLYISDETIGKKPFSHDDLPVHRVQKLMEYFELPYNDALLISEEKVYFNLFQEIVQDFPKPEKVAGWINVEVRKLRNEGKNINLQHKSQELAKIFQLHDDKQISRENARILLKRVILDDVPLDNLIRQNDFKPVDDIEVLKFLLQEVIKENPVQWQEFCRGKEKLEKYFIGQMMRKLKGKGNAGLIKNVINKLKN